MFDLLFANSAGLHLLDNVKVSLVLDFPSPSPSTLTLSILGNPSFSATAHTTATSADKPELSTVLRRISQHVSYFLQDSHKTKPGPFLLLEILARVILPISSTLQECVCLTLDQYPRDLQSYTKINV